MLKIMDRPRALETEVINGIRFPGQVDLPPLEAPIFNLIIKSRLKFGPTFILFNDGPIADVILAHSDINLNLQKCHSYSQQTVLLAKGTVITFYNDVANVGNIIITAYTYYWEV